MNGQTLLSDRGLGTDGLCAPPANEGREIGGESAPIRLESLKDRCLDNAACCGMALHKFAARSGDHMAALTRALESGNALELAREAQSLGGVAESLSAEALRGAADELKRAAAGDMQGAQWMLVRTREEIARCVDAIDGLLEQLSAECSSHAAP